MNAKYRVEHIGEGMWIIVKGDDYDHAKIYGTRADATSAAQSYNLWESVSGEVVS